MSEQPLFSPYNMANLLLPNRIVMAPLTRMRAHPEDHIPTEVMAEYTLRGRAPASSSPRPRPSARKDLAGRIRRGSGALSRYAGGANTDRVHKSGGRMIAQLWHTGAISHPELRDGELPLSASDVDPVQISVTRTGRKPTVAPRAMTPEQIRATVQDYARAAENALEAGFDGVQILANYLYLIAQFMNVSTNRRTDEYGGKLENRARFLFEVVESVVNAVGADKTGVKLSPMHEAGAFVANEETLPVAEYAIQRLNDYSLSHLLLMGNTTDFTDTPLEKLVDDGMFEHFRPLYRGTLIANVRMDRDRGNHLISSGLADLVAFGRPYISNPDLVERFRNETPLAESDWNSVYASGAEGYSDYPTSQITQ